MADKHTHFWIMVMDIIAQEPQNNEHQSKDCPDVIYTIKPDVQFVICNGCKALVNLTERLLGVN